MIFFAILLYSDHSDGVDPRGIKIMTDKQKTEMDVLLERYNSPEYHAEMDKAQADLIARRKQREDEIEKERMELEAEIEAEHQRHLKKPDRNASVIATPQEIAAAER